MLKVTNVEYMGIDSLEKEWIPYPVLHFDLSTAKHVDWERLEQELNLKFLEYERIYGRGEDEIQSNQRLQGLIRFLRCPYGTNERHRSFALSERLYHHKGLLPTHPSLYA